MTSSGQFEGQEPPGLVGTAPDGKPAYAPAAPAVEAGRGLWVAWQARLFQPVPIAPLVYARMAFGLLMLVEVVRYFRNGWIRRCFIEPAYHFTYYGFEWVRPWPGLGMYVHFAVLGLLAVFIAAGFLYRLSAVLFFLGFTYVFLIEEALYLNHFYLLVLIGFLLALVPAHRALAVDALLRPGIYTPVAPAWSLFLLRFQVAVVYLFGGIAKITPDWLRGEPMRMWLKHRAETAPHLLGEWLAHEAAAYFFSYGGLLLDLLLVPMLLWRRTRLMALVAAVMFHVLNAMLFRIGIFPWFMLAATLLLMPDGWWRRVGEKHMEIPAQALGVGARFPARPVVAAFVAVYVLIQVLVPLRHWLYPGVVHWTEEGHRFAWHMKLRSKEGSLALYVYEPETGRHWRVDPRGYLESWQWRRATVFPDMMLQLARHVAEDLRRKGRGDVRVEVDSRVSLNGRAPQRFIDPHVDLSRQRRSLCPARWVLPLRDSPPGVRPLGEPLGDDPEASGD